jgi:PrtD family type I secretion system ABC transporter
MRSLIARFRPFFAYAALFSLAVNLLQLAAPLYMLQVFDRVLASRSEETLLLLTLAAVAALALMAALDVVRSWLLQAGGVIAERTLGPRVLDEAIRRAAAPRSLQRRGGPGTASSRDVGVLRAFLGGPAMIALFDAPWLPLYLLVIFLFHPLLGLVATAGAVIMVLLAWANERSTRGALERAQSQARRAGRFADASLRNAEVVGALGMHGALERRWTEMNDAALAEQLSAGRAGGAFSGLTKFTRQLLQIAMLAVGGWLVIDHSATAGIMMAGTIILGRALAPVESLVAGWRSLVEARSAWQRIEALLGDGASRPQATELPAPQGRLDVERVSFAPLGAERPILRGVAFGIAAGESLGIIGPSAAGKSSLARLLAGIWKPNSGAVRLDGADLAAIPREHIAPYVGYLPQDVELFAGTVAQNIARLEEPDAARVVAAAQRAFVHEMILRLPKGYDTEIGEGGQALSPGQRQRIALARALYGEPRLVVLDEPNANLDREGEDALLKAIARLKEDGATVVLIAHRPALFARVDKLLVLVDGAVELFGPRAEVMARVMRPARPVRSAVAA